MAESPTFPDRHGATRQRAAWRGAALDAVLFDLDGTVLDTVSDISLALNRALAEAGWASVAVDQVRRMIGRGAPLLVQRAAAAQGRAPAPAELAMIVERYLHFYGALQDDNEFAAIPFPGAADGLRQLHEGGLRIAIVTNKQHRFAVGLVNRLGLGGWVDLVVGGDSCERRKPDPQPLFFACERLQVPVPRALMVGDSINDVLAARAAAMPVICVPYGYNEGEDPRSLPCDAFVGSLAELPALFWPAAGAAPIC